MKISTIRPTAMLEMFGEKEVQAIAEEVEWVIVEIMDKAAG